MERKAALRCRDRRRDEGAARSAIHVCDTVRGDAICFHSVVPVSDASDLLKRPPSTVRRRSRLRLVSTRKERTMRGRTRWCGVRSGMPRPSHGQAARERYETETCETPVRCAPGGPRKPRRRATAPHGRPIDVASMHGDRFPYDRPTRRTAADPLLALRRADLHISISRLNGRRIDMPRTDARPHDAGRDAMRRLRIDAQHVSIRRRRSACRHVRRARRLTISAARTRAALARPPARPPAANEETP